MRWSSKLPIEFVLVILGKTLNCLLLLNPKLKLYTYMQSKLFKGFMSFTLIANALMIPLSIAANSFTWSQAILNVSVCLIMTTSLLTD